MVALGASLRCGLAALVLSPLPVLPAAAQTVRGNANLDLRGYPDAPLRASQDRDRVQTSLSTSLTASGDVAPLRYDMELFGRLAPDNARRVVGDVRRATIGGTGDRVEWRAGVLAETWGVLEAWNPVDIVNQRDLSEDFQGKVKFGQPGALATLHAGAVEVTGYVTTYARARRFARGEDRQQITPAPIVSTRFDGGRWSPGGGVRATLSAGELDIGVGQFFGPAREPVLSPVIAGNALVGLAARYDRIGQSSVDAQYVLGANVFKLEAIRRTGGGAFWGGGIGMERQIGHPLGLSGELTAYAEFYYDDRDARAPVTPFQRDLFVGARYAFKDTRDSLVEVRTTHDVQWGSTLFELRGTRRVFENVLLLLDLLVPIDPTRDPALTNLRRDANLRIGITRYF